MHEYRDYLGVSSVSWEPLAYTRFLLFVSELFGNHPIRGVIESTPGFRVLMAKMWTVLPRLERTKPAFETCLWFLASIIGSLDPAHFAEMVDGAGGTPDDLASLVLRHIDVVVHGNLSWEVGSAASYMRFLAHLVQAAPLRHRERFIQTLRRRDFIPALLLGMNALLEHFLDTPMGYRWLPAAIEAGLLTLIAGVATEFPSIFDDRLRFLLTKLLPDGLLYYHVVAAMDNVLDDLTEIWSTEELEIFDDWSSFRDLAERRVRLLDGLPSTGACDNLETVRDDSRAVPLPTSARSRTGNAAGRCGVPTTLILADTNACTLGFRERQFTRAVVQDGFTENMRAIYQHQVMFIASDPADRFYTLFDYTCDPIDISVESVADSPAGGGRDSEWADILGRAEHSHGRVHVHVVEVPEGSATRVWVLPLRTNSPQIHDALRPLGRSTSAGCEEDELGDQSLLVGKRDEDAGRCGAAHGAPLKGNTEARPEVLVQIATSFYPLKLLRPWAGMIDCGSAPGKQCGVRQGRTRGLNRVNAVPRGQAMEGTMSTSADTLRALSAPTSSSTPPSATMSTSADTVRALPTSSYTPPSPLPSPPSSPSLSASGSSVSSFPSVSSSFFFSSAAASPPHVHPPLPESDPDTELVIPSLLLPPPHSPRPPPSESSTAPIRLLILGRADVVTAALLPSPPAPSAWSTEGGVRVLRTPWHIPPAPDITNSTLELVALGPEVRAPPPSRAPTNTPQPTLPAIANIILAPFRRVAALLAPPLLSAEGGDTQLLEALLAGGAAPLYAALVVVPPVALGATDAPQTQTQIRSESDVPPALRALVPVFVLSPPPAAPSPHELPASECGGDAPPTARTETSVPRRPLPRDDSPTDAPRPLPLPPSPVAPQPHTPVAPAAFPFPAEPLKRAAARLFARWWRAGGAGACDEGDRPPPRLGSAGEKREGLHAGTGTHAPTYYPHPHAHADPLHLPSLLALVRGVARALRAAVGCRLAGAREGGGAWWGVGVGVGFVAGVVVGVGVGVGVARGL
ncbi:hypothetical protein DFH07DRAFT_773737 [Mycena maculata]|uniref:Uncharacterized protein n=1 Tax=Mycena maculata TaxID=230809 RepID=A0AAD7NBX9_9AGAR|nr:hypothetical protein DFH07DRAFT_773737 [Mycena maculata]